MRKAKTEKKINDIKNDVPFLVPVGNKEYKCKYLKSRTSEIISMLIVNEKEENPKNAIETLKGLKMNGRNPAKITSLLILNSYWKIRLFHWVFWRYLFTVKENKDFTQAIAVCIEAMQLDSFSLSVALTSKLNTLRIRMTQEEQERLYQEQLSDQKPTS